MPADRSRFGLCILAESFAPVVGGMEQQMRLLAEGMAARDIRTTVVTLRNRADLAEREQMDGYVVHRVAPSAGRWAACVPVFRQLGRLRTEYDIVLVDGFRALGIPAVLSGRMHGKRVVLRAENNGEFSGDFFDAGLRRVGLTRNAAPVRALNAGRQRVLRRADAFVAISRSIRDELVEYGVLSSQITLIPNSVDARRFRPPAPGEREALRAKLGLPLDARIVCFTGRLVAWKGPLVLLEAWRELMMAGVASSASDRADGPPLLLFLGAGGFDQENCEAEARRVQREAGLEGSVRFLGDVSNVHEYLRAADIFALPTANDSFAIAVTEAMATGLPIVTTQVAGLADYVVPGVNALAVAPGDVRAVHDALQRLLIDPALRTRLGAEAVRTASRFSHERVIEQHLELFHELANARSASRHAVPDSAPLGPISVLRRSRSSGR